MSDDYDPETALEELKPSLDQFADRLKAQDMAEKAVQYLEGAEYISATEEALLCVSKAYLGLLKEQAFKGNK